MILEQLFGSRTRWKLLRIFLSHPDEAYYVRELARLTKETLNSVRRELANLEEWGIVAGVDVTRDNEKKTKKYYQAQMSFVLFNELKQLVMKSWLLIGSTLAQKIDHIGKLVLVIVAGRFIGDKEADTDALIVGTVNRDQLVKLMKVAERQLGGEVRFTLMTRQEYEHRMTVTDKFLYRIFEREHVKVIDKLPKN